MAGISIQRFDGMEPSVSARLLADTAATAAVNANLLDGSLRGIHVPRLIREMDHGVVVLQSSFKIKHVKADGSLIETWADFPHPYTDFIKGPLVNDAYARYYWTSPGAPAVEYSTVERIAAKLPAFLLGVPAPPFTPILSVVPDANQALTNVTRTYVYTYVTAYGEEGPPSLPVTAMGKPNDIWHLQFAEANGAIIDPRRPIIKRRLYRTIFASNGQSQYWRVADIPLAIWPDIPVVPVPGQDAIDPGTFTPRNNHDDTASDLTIGGASGSLLASTTWQPPPAGIGGMILMPDGFLMGFKGRDIYFSEKFRPHAWPPVYTLTVEHPIVGLGVFGQTCIVMTEGHPVALSGSMPGNISITKTNTAEPCLSRGSIVSSPEGVYYASHNGLVLVSQSGVVNITQALISKDIWGVRYKPAQLRSARYKTQYIGINDAGRGFILNLGAQRVALSEFNSLLAGQNLMNDLWTGEVHLIGRNNVYLWDPEAAAPVAALWRSKEFHLPKPLNMGVLSIDYGDRDAPVFPVLLGSFEQAPPLLTGQDFGPPIVVPLVYPSAVQSPGPTDLTSSQPITLPLMTEEVRLDEDKDLRMRIWAGRQLVFDQQVPRMQIVRLPSGFKSDLWQVEIISRVPVMQVTMAETMKDLRLV